MDAPGGEHHDAIRDFIDEGQESLRGLPAQLDAYRAAPTVAEPINAVFRAIHSIKGCAAFLGLGAIRAFSHALESTLDVVRTECVPLHEPLERSLIEGFDRLDALLQEAAGGQVLAELQPEDLRILESVQTAASSCAPAAPAERALAAAVAAIADRMDAGSEELQEFGRQLRAVVRDYAGQADQIHPRQPELPPPPKPTPSDLRDARFACGEIEITPRVAPLLQFFLDFAEHRNSRERERAFLDQLLGFAEWARRAGAAELSQALESAAADFRTVHESPLDFDDGLLSLIWDHLAAALGKLRTVEAGAPQADSAKTPSPSGEAGASQPAAKSRFVRVKEERLDEFLEHVSRMFITSERFRDVQSRIAETGRLPELAEHLRQINMDLKLQSTALQQGVMALRRVSISGLLSKLPRMARTLASQLGKQIHVHLTGEETEIDKQLSEDLDAPLTHLVRNVLDHGIEPPDQRRACGKPESGNLSIEARLTRNQVILLVRDDGRGMDPKRLRAKAVEKGILSGAEADAMTDEDALQLIFRPGFSTAERVSEVSGRGVGMDVVRAVVQEHRGVVNVDSAIGRGTTISLEFPVRQATLVIDGLMVVTGAEHFVIPFENIKEIVQLNPSDIVSVHGRSVATVRGSVHTAVHLGEITATSTNRPQATGAETAVIVQCKGGSLCLRVDEVLGHRQVVVTSLEDLLPNSTGLAGIAQLGGERLAPVLNISEVFKSFAESSAITGPRNRRPA